MPFIHTKTNRPISKEAEQSLARDLGRAVTLLGKSENWLMLQFEDNCRMYFRGRDDRPLAFVRVMLYGKAGDDAYGKMTAEITRLVSQALDIDPDGIYVAYGETEHWGWQGSNC